MKSIKSNSNPKSKSNSKKPSKSDKLLDFSSAFILNDFESMLDLIKKGFNPNNEDFVDNLTGYYIEQDSSTLSVLFLLYRHYYTPDFVLEIATPDNFPLIKYILVNIPDIKSIKYKKILENCIDKAKERLDDLQYDEKNTTKKTELKEIKIKINKTKEIIKILKNDYSKKFGAESLK